MGQYAVSVLGRAVKNADTIRPTGKDEYFEVTTRPPARCRGEYRSMSTEYPLV